MEQPVSEVERVRELKGRAGRLGARVRYGRRKLRRLSRTATLGGLFLSFLRIGAIGFGGGLAVLAQIRTLVVTKRRWFTEREFAEALALAQSLPGTSAGNAVTYVGYRLLGWRGAAVAMSGFILPSMAMMIGLAILYRHFRALPDTDRLFHGLNAAVVALIVVTAWQMGKAILHKRWQRWLAISACLAVVFFKATVIEVVLLAGIIGIYVDSYAERRWQKWRRIRRLAEKRRALLARYEADGMISGYLTMPLAELEARRSKAKEPSPQETGRRTGERARAAATASLLLLSLFTKLTLLLSLAVAFLRIGAVAFGGGFAMIPLIEAEVVEARHWLTRQEFADATALGQITPGPVLISATFIGYRVAGVIGALVATFSIFLPAFLMTILAGSSLRRFRSNRQVQAFLRGVAPAVVGLLIASAWSIGRAGIHTWIGVSIAALAIIVLLRFRLNAAWIVFGAGLLRFLIGLILW
ncbi:chromate transporter [Pyrinomonas methylaliphatogenes]|jgi:chromate transporter|uniref:Chromate transport protein ChrA n=1 Tax=Pyrinomonas methylaliphatogenes TaxID=454194 RepID=A0A0B6WV74_9BACT|nr:chromate transporter [Pyrinomonas methylaliphatogenes]CDM64154.1 chromate transport protein ChrA [Pyrinomonas methylaliphatogenes]